VKQHSGQRVEIDQTDTALVHRGQHKLYVFTGD